MSVEKLYKFVESPNIAEMLDDEFLKEIVDDVSTGFNIDEDSCADWMKMNKDALKMIKSEADTKQTKGYAHCKVIYPLLTSATIQLQSRLIPHLVRNNKVVECAVAGPDVDGVKAQKASAISNFFSYELLIDSNSWLKEAHKLIMMFCAWGTAYKKLYFDEGQDKVLSEVISPEDVIINTNTSSIDKARRITVRNYLTKNQIIEYVRAGRFLDVEDKIDSFNTDEHDEVNPVYEILEQFCYIDLDEDGYEEPYIVHFHQDSETVLGIYSAYESEDIHVNEKGKVKKIVPTTFIVDFHCIDDPEGKFHSMGLNQLLYHQNKSITSVLRQLIDSGTLANQQGGFVTKAFKTKKRDIEQKLGMFTQLETPPGVDIRSQVMPLPFKEPSQVLFALLGLLIDAGKETGFITQALTGDAQGQNVPATTMLAIVEQGTRAFKPMVQKLFHSEKTEFKWMYNLYGKHSSFTRFVKYQDVDIEVSKELFNDDGIDIMPVADPTQSSEAHKYMKIQAVQQMLQTPMANVLNMQAVATKMLKDLQIENPESLIMKPSPPPPDPKLIEAQNKHQISLGKLELEKDRGKRDELKLEIEMLELQLKRNELLIKQQESDEKQLQMLASAKKDIQESEVKERMTKVAEDKVEVERDRLALMDKQQRNENSSENS